MASLQRRCAAGGVEFRWQTNVGGWRIEGGRVRVAGIEADEFVLCAGVWTDGLGRELGLRLPMQAGKGFSLTLTKPPRSPKSCALLTEARRAVRPINRELRLCGPM